eukprot:CAMPEP_0116575270 /NCGR_PEP_ID=MMETSP0397-20121206/19864_1 /TAXON_ID=216820 /ORGANISM="Cyclophora tenuis, Strain ECT3854" /LENGTH=138 /DNA_ID=CAMNT_0004104143 /DNA_START=33 /DNA_END=449 /DNA_ORIENTATION=-
MPGCMRTAFCVDEEPEGEKDQKLLRQAKEFFDQFVVVKENPNKISYDAYLGPFMAGYMCDNSRFVALHGSIDLNKEDGGSLTWHEWRFWCLWALRTHPNSIGVLDELHAVILRSAIVPYSIVGTDNSASSVLEEEKKE